MGRKYTDEQIIQIIKEVEAGLSVKEACRQHGISNMTYYKWKNHLGAWKQTNCVV